MCGVWSVEWSGVVWSGVWSVECGVWSVECGVWSGANIAYVLCSELSKELNKELN